jgi:hypothetical protein
MKRASLIHRTAVRALIVDLASQRHQWRHGCRVASSYLDTIEADLRALITRRLETYTGKGITLK